MTMQDKPIFEQKYSVLDSDMDINYLVTPLAVLKYYQDCVSKFMASRHLAAFDLVQKKLFWNISEQNVRFTDTRAVWGDKIVVEIWINGIVPSKIFINYRVRIENGREFAEGCASWSILHLDTREPAEMEKILKDAGIKTEEEKERVHVDYNVEPGKPVSQLNHVVNLTDLDISGHTGNASYLRLAVNALSANEVKDLEPDFLSIRFLKESFLKDSLTCNLYQTEDAHEQTIARAEIVNASGCKISQIYCTWRPNIGHEYSAQVQQLRRSVRH